MTEDLPDEIRRAAIDAAIEAIELRWMFPLDTDEMKEYRALIIQAVLDSSLPLIRAHIADELRAYALPEYLVKGTVGFSVQREIVLDCANHVARARLESDPHN